MNQEIRPGGYAIDIEPLSGTVSAWRGETLVAQSDRAVVMYETRLAPSVYFPKTDVKIPLSDKTPLKTFCPFKGTAYYRDMMLDGERLQNAVWAYEDPLPESQGVADHVGFMPDTITHLDLGNASLRKAVESHITAPLVDWLLREAGSLPTPEAFTAALAERLLESGIALSRISVMIWSLHPLIAGKNYVWEKQTGDVNTYAPTYEIHDHPAFVNSPLRHVSQGLGGVRQKLGADYAENSFPILQDLREMGATDYVAMPLPFSDGRTNVLTLTCDHPDGFTTAHLGLIFECSSVISRFYEVFQQKDNAQALLETYVGKRTGARVLGGDIRRGDGDEIDAAIMFCDLRGSTRLEQSMGRAAYIALLNQFFEITSDVVHLHEGEVLKFIGDAVLAVFPAGEDHEAACARAVASAREIIGKLAASEGEHTCAASIGISFGQVTYGNIGSRERLDFTVIGKAANVAARLCDYGKKSGHAVVLSVEVAGAAEGNDDLGLVDLHNVAEPVQAYGALRIA
ncbi:MAG: DUF427 domain-containing protein [Sulfitobacter sp.]|nr:DUF427 domain-containing protein [Sulfitobacter sp.]